jgi:hypothetical protein
MSDSKLIHQDDRLCIIKGYDPTQGEFYKIIDHIYPEGDDVVFLASEKQGLIINKTGLSEHAYFTYGDLVTDYMVTNMEIGC